MKTIIFLKRLLAVAGLIVYCSAPAQTGRPKALNKPVPRPDLILTLPDQPFAEEKTTSSVNSNVAANNRNENQVFTTKKIPVNVDCDMDVIQNTLDDIPLSNRIFGECDFHYHY
ncbi:hypothetical protein [Candidatus Methylobacter oryzae]|uniref:Uncharacterized protein n=1 Tax=Candidatus Methylobacter oryzae TaxID=2497749 RepID=A0ABY3CH55_9GAMM|nr:hypothetical protein [Candidatus Methylobacter oryzae]TRX03314.1 hypothetical protein EKO24_000755 [Candidatus Methylobacter oryzae]